MTEVNIQQSPQPVVVERPVAVEKGSSHAVWAILVLVLLGVIAWFIFGGPLHRTHATITVNTPRTGAIIRPMGPGFAL